MWWISAVALAQSVHLSADGSVDRDDLGALTVPDVESPGAVVGGHSAPSGKWNDAVAVVFYASYVGCSGTLIGPRTVLTAGHCVLGAPVTHVIVGSTDWTDASQGEIIEVTDVYEYPDSQRTYDVALLTLAESSSYEPRAIAVDCIVKDYLDDGAPVQMVGWGATSEYGTDFNFELNEAPTHVLDKNCSQDIIGEDYTECKDVVRPGGELVAGDPGEKSVCYGDSGGPLYLKTEVGDFVVGVASHLIIGPAFYTAPCTEGGVWVRPDAVIDWIEDTVGPKKITLPTCNDAPSVEIPDLTTHRNHAGSVELLVDDPDGDGSGATLAIAGGASHGKASVDGHTITYTPNEGYVGDDEIGLSVTDVGTAQAHTGDPVTIDIVVPVHVESAFLGIGCATSPAGAGWAPLLLGFLAARHRGRAPRR